MAADWEPKLSPEERRALLEFDLREAEAQVEDLLRVMAVRSPEVDSLTRIGSMFFGLTAFVKAEHHAVLAAVTMEMLNRERGRYR